MAPGVRELYVEGKDDVHAILHVMRHYGVECSVNQPRSGKPNIKHSNSVDEVLKSIEVAVSAMAGGMTGFVVDADTGPQSRWQAICDRLRKVHVETPAGPPSEGFIGTSAKFKTRVGVWLMPDNRTAGILEDFLTNLMEEGDCLLGHAEEATVTAKHKGATFKDAYHQKAVIHAWLAWQEEPGQPFGTAITKRYLRADRPAGEQFARWFMKLFQLEQE
ncbi:MAG: DUF3226 domain-containing protein [Candidatus Hydrogenedentota bacterium]